MNKGQKYLLRAVETAEHRAATKELTEAKEELTKLREITLSLIANYQPTWHYSMEKTGYECAFCQAVILRSGDFNNPELHEDDCPWPGAVEWSCEQPELDE